MRRRFGASGGRGRGGNRRRRCRATIAGFAEDLPRYARSLRRSMRDGDVPRFAIACKLIRDFARPLGFGELAVVADEAVASVRRTRSLDRSREEVAVLAMLCDRPRAA